MKISWGYRIVFVFIAFVSLIATLVYGSMKTKVDMVSDKYYADELKYQDVLDNAANASKLKAPVTINQDSNGLTVQYPVENGVSGNIRFYFAADSRQDKAYEISTNSDGMQYITKEHWPVGYYVVKIDWKAGGTSYYTEQKIWVN